MTSSSIECLSALVDGVQAIQTAADRVVFLATSLAQIENARFAACLLREHSGSVLGVKDKKGREHPDWEPVLLVQLEEWSRQNNMATADLPMPTGIPEGEGLLLHVVRLSCRGEQYGVLGVAVPKESLSSESEGLACLKWLAHTLGPWFRLESVEREDHFRLQHAKWLDRLLGADMAEAVIHEFNNLFNNLVLQLEIMKRRGVSDDFQSQMATLQEKCREVAALLKKLHRFRETRQTSLEPVDMNQVVQETVVGKAGGVAKQWPAPVVLDLDKTLPPLLADPFDLTRLIELLLNHATALTTRSGRVLVRTERVNNRQRVVVQDDGPGVPPADLYKLLEPFTAVRPGGDEWTLAVSKILARHLHGALRAENLPEGGLGFTVEFNPEHQPRGGVAKS
jgi:signal transduction histidine kinase